MLQQHYGRGGSPHPMTCNGTTASESAPSQLISLAAAGSFVDRL
jgi:hypothetical protein